MANLTAVLRKTIDGLPNASPQLRAKVYEKARAAITRQIEAANPPLEDHVVEARYRVLEDAIRETEAHYNPPQDEVPPAELDAPAPERAETPALEPVRAEPAPVAVPAPRAPAPALPQAPPPGFAAPRPLPPVPSYQPSPPPIIPEPQEPVEEWSAPVRIEEPRRDLPPQPAAERPLPPVFTPRATPTTRPPPLPPTPRAPLNETVGSARPGETPAMRPAFPGSLPPVRAPSSGPERTVLPGGLERADTELPRVGEVGPTEAAPPVPVDPRASRQLRPASLPLPTAERSGGGAPPYAGIPEPDLAAPRYPARRAQGKDRSRLSLGVAIGAIVLLGGLGTYYLDDIRSLVTGGGSGQVASNSSNTTDSAEPPASVPANETPATAAAPQGAVNDTAPAAIPPATNTSTARQFTQRLLPDGSEVDEGPGVGGVNPLEEGTNVVAAEINPAATQPPPTAAEPAPTTPTQTPAQGAIPVGQRAVFYEERSANREGTQQDGNVVWSLVQEPPAEGKPAEPAIQAVADIPSTGMKMTMTIRRNADQTLPASHVIEVMFDTPNGAPGGGIENVQRLALKPTEQARGEPLIGISGKISDGFFIIALNDLPEAVRSNLALLGKEEWIDIPLAYNSGQRALMSIEKGIPGARVFKQALDAWAAKKN
ncbi:hypothetical protein [Aureimonas sp. N4]|uniref:hypothetical protein n=1 Tax=Aureimonas sp. N4 TaxID=1638165 RepID=UPI000781E6B5|nr:hypothetical protein [Aureimonas sp. N4]